MGRRNDDGHREGAGTEESGGERGRVQRRARESVSERERELSGNPSPPLPPDN